MIKQARPFDLSLSPVGVWNFQNSLEDLTSNNYDLTVDAGTLRYAPLTYGLGGIVLDGVTSFVHDVAGTALEILGDVTVMALVKLFPSVTETNYIVSYTSQTNGNSATNILYALTTHSGTNGRYVYRYAHHIGNNTLAPYPALSSSNTLGVDFNTALIGFTRTSGVIRFYKNDKIINDPYSLSSPAGGSLSRFRIGAQYGTTNVVVGGVIGGVKIINSAITGDQWKDQYNRTLGPLHGRIL
jgi:hypothetical protein